MPQCTQPTSEPTTWRVSFFWSCSSIILTLWVFSVLATASSYSGPGRSGMLPRWPRARPIQ